MGLLDSRQRVECADSSRRFFWRVATAREASQSGAWERRTPHASRGSKTIDFEWGSWTRASVWSAPAAAGAFFCRVATVREASQSGAWERPTPHASRGIKAIDFEWGSWTRASVWSAPTAAGAFFGASPPRGKRPKAALGSAALHTLRAVARQLTLNGAPGLAPACGVRRQQPALFFAASPPCGKRPKAALGSAPLPTLRAVSRQLTLNGAPGLAPACGVRRQQSALFLARRHRAGSVPKRRLGAPHSTRFAR